VVRSVLDRMKSAFNVSAAEVDTHDDVKLATLAFAVVGFENAAVQGALQKIVEALRVHPVCGSTSAVRSQVGREVV